MHGITCNIRVYNIIMYLYNGYARIIYSGEKKRCIYYYYHRRRGRYYYYYYLLLPYNTTPPGVAAVKQHLRTMDAKSSEIMCPHV